MEILIFLAALAFLYQRSRDGGLNPWFVIAPTAFAWILMYFVFNSHSDPGFVYMGVALRWGWVLTICWMVWAAYFHQSPDPERR